MKEYINIGSAPMEEDCVQVTDKEPYIEDMKIECQIFKRYLQRRWPEGDFRIKSFQHDFGTYYEVCAFYENEKETEAAFAAEGEADKWDDEAKAELRAKLPHRFVGD